MGMVWLMIAQGITLISITRNRTMAMARPTPKTIPSTKPISVPFSVTNAWKTRLRFEVTACPVNPFHNSPAT